MLLVPFILALSGVIWDMRAFLGHRAELAREVYSVAEVISSQTSTSPIEPVAEAFADRFRDAGAGSIDIAVVTRGAQREVGGVNMACNTFVPDADADGDEDDDDDALNWCRPQVRVRWPGAAAPRDGLWSERCPALSPSCVAQLGGNHCQENGRSTSTLPRQGEHFPSIGAVFPNEAGADESRWLSRLFSGAEWWVVVDVCLEPGHGTFTGRLIPAGMQALDFSELTVGVRGAWRALELLNDCDWCVP